MVIQRTKKEIIKYFSGDTLRKGDIITHEGFTSDGEKFIKLHEFEVVN